jgi:hypothetical protein
MYGNLIFQELRVSGAAPNRVSFCYVDYIYYRMKLVVQCFSLFSKVSPINLQKAVIQIDNEKKSISNANVF